MLAPDFLRRSLGTAILIPEPPPSGQLKTGRKILTFIFIDLTPRIREEKQLTFDKGAVIAQQCFSDSLVLESAWELRQLGHALRKGKIRMLEFNAIARTGSAQFD